MTLQDKLNLVTNYFAEDWAIDKAMQLLEDYENAQQPSPSAAATEGEVPLPLLVRDIAADLGTTPIQVCTALAQLGFGGHSVNMAVTPRMAKSLRAHFASTTSQADSQLAKFTEILQSWCGARCLPMPSSDDCQSLMLSLEAARAPADSQPAPRQAA